MTPDTGIDRFSLWIFHFLWNHNAYFLLSETLAGLNIGVTPTARATEGDSRHVIAKLWFMASQSENRISANLRLPIRFSVILHVYKTVMKWIIDVLMGRALSKSLIPISVAEFSGVYAKYTANYERGHKFSIKI